MNGIAGIVYPGVVQGERTMYSMLNVLQQGKETGRDLHMYNNIQVGSTGNRLALNEKKTIVCGFDGVIYNLPELHRLLIKQGRHPAAASTNELLVLAYEVWGIKFLQKIDGDFALMILDSSNKRIILARDRIGKKPLFWFHSNNHFIFGSQIKALLATGLVPQTAACDTLASYFYFGYLPQDMTPIKEVNKLLPGHYLQYNFNESKIIEPYWSYSSFFQNPIHQHKNTIATTVNAQLERSVVRRLGDDNTLGCFITGGLGSASIAYYVKKLAKNKEIKSYTVGFLDENEQDVEAARLVANRLGIHQEISYVTPSNFLDDLVNIVWHLDEPLADPQIVATWSLAKLASQGVQTVFSGMGSDELLAGHTRYTDEEQKLSLFSKLLHLPKPFIYQFVVPIINFINKPLSYRCMKYCRSDPWQFEYLKKNALFDQNTLDHASPMLSTLFDPEVFLHKFHNLSRIKSKISSYLYFDVKTRLVDNFILQYERLTQAHNLSWNTPFLDLHLIEFLASLPEPEHLIESETALFLKMLMKEILPPTVVERPKKNRPNFLSSWVNTPEMVEICRLLHKGTLVETGMISHKWLQHITESPEHRQKAFKYLWAVIVLEIWFQLMINHPISHEPPNKSVLELLS